MTMGAIVMYAGIGLIVLGILAILLCVPLFKMQRKKYEQEILEQYE